MRPLLFRLGLLAMLLSIGAACQSPDLRATSPETAAPEADTRSPLQKLMDRFK